MRSKPPKAVSATGKFAPEPPRDCALCPRLHAFLDEQRASHPGWFNAPVPSFGEPDAQLLVVGLAPGLKGANRTGRPFTGDFAGDLLYATLIKHGFATGTYGSRPDDGLKLVNCMITNAVRCVPPQNKPTPAEIRTCRPYFISRMRALPRLRILLALGRIAHDQVLAAMDLKKAAYPFAHGRCHMLATPELDAAGQPSPDAPQLLMFDSFHCSRYNTNTGRLTPAMFSQVFADIRAALKQA
jgi:uracil-DNA glycosylase family 4